MKNLQPDAVLFRFITILQLSLSLILLFSTQGKAQCSKPPIIHSNAASSDGVINGSTIQSTVIHCLHENAMEYHWLLNGSTYQMTSDSHLIISKLPGGNIQCQVDQCAQLSDSITIITPPMFTTSPVNITSDVGNNFTLSCESSGYPYPTITWFDYDSVVVGHGSQLYVDNAMEGDTGVYTCLALNEAGYRTTTVWVTVVSDVISSTTSSSFIDISSRTSTTMNIHHLSTVDSLTSLTRPSSSPTESNEGATTDSLVIILAIVVPGFSLVMLILIGVCYWLAECQRRNEINDRFNDATDGQTIKTSTSYVNSTFKEVDDYDTTDSDEYENVEIQTNSKSGEYRAVYAAHAYKSESTNLFDSSKPNVKRTRRVTITDSDEEPADDDNYTSSSQLILPFDKVTYDEVINVEDTPQNNQSSHAEEHRSGQQVPSEHLLEGEELTLIDEDTISEEHLTSNMADNNIPETTISDEIVEESTSNGGQIQAEEQQQEQDSIQEPKPPPSKWLTEKRSDNRSDPLSGLQLVNLVRKLDLTSAKDVRNHLSEQFKSVLFNLTSPHDLPPDTMSKNRYRDVVPTPETSVVLSNTGDPLSTYINANFIKGFDGNERTYISAQGPLYDTVPDFWRMIWENEVEAIVMVTALYEGGKNKCAKYWPSLGESDTQSYGDLIVRNVHEETNENYKITFLCVSMINDPGSMRDVYHFSFLGWPDFGAPNDGYAMLQLWKAVESIRNPKPTLLVHCSAGIGRSGTYIAIDIGIRQYEQDGEVDPLLILSLLRQDRGGMIQTLEQYEYLHRVLSCYIVQNL